jgi:pSer/pThr/pTyr-binding forkhead associated (FHA) protein
MQLVQLDGHKTQQISKDTEDLNTAPIHAAPEAMSTWISLHLLDSGQIIPISDRTEFTIGRISENQPIMPDIDLSPYMAFEHGVSRLHAVIRLVNGEASLMDLGSSNGTYLNGVRLIPNTESPIRHGDLVALGKLKIQIILSL